MEKAGRKIRITGKGRCNLTNARPAEEFIDHVRANAYFFNVAFSEFNNRATIRFFERLGVKLDIERGERVFPHSGKAWDIANALTEYCEEHGVEIMYHTRVTEILTLGGRVYGVKYINRRGFERKEECENVIVATGGVSYPRPVRRATATPSPMLWGIRSSRCVRHSRRFARRTLREYLNGLLLKTSVPNYMSTTSSDRRSSAS